jgi:Kef-type K+ transport system membrane component KefB
MHGETVSSLNVLTLVGAATVLGFYAGGLARRIKLPTIIGYMALGVLIGPSILNLFPEAMTENLSFITELALGFVAFSIGAELSFASLKRQGWGIVSIILAESFAAFFVVLGAVYALTRDLPMALIFGAMAPASAPAGTVAVIQEYKAKGSLTKALYAVVGFDDGLAIVIFGLAAACAKSLLVNEATGTTASILPALWPPLKEIAASLAVGGVLAVIFGWLQTRVTRSADTFILLFGFVVLATGLSIQWHLSLILTNMVIGCVLVNTRREALVHRVTAPLLEVMPLLFVLFFCLAGTHLQIAALPALGGVGVVYILGRTTGLIGGAWLGGRLGKVDDNVRKYVGLGILSQAGVAIGLALIVRHEFGILAAAQGIEHAARIGDSVLTTVTATCIFFEVVGPICTKIALTKAGEITVKE